MRAGTAAFATIPFCLETGSTRFRSVCNQCYVINYLEKALKMFSFGSHTWVTCNKCVRSSSEVGRVSADGR
jgi:hypothetical protein